MRSVNKKFNKLVKHFGESVFDVDLTWDDVDDLNEKCNDSGCLYFDGRLSFFTSISFDVDARQAYVDTSYDGEPPYLELDEKDISVSVTKVYYMGEELGLTINQINVLEDLLLNKIDIKG